MFNHAIALMGSGGEDGWMRNIQEHVRHAKTLIEQLDLWCSHIPAPVNILHPRAGQNQLAHLIWIRGMACREWIRRPFLYHVIHQTENDRVPEEVLHFARESLQICVDLISASFPRRMHRHHGTWYLGRGAITRALMLLAAAQSGKDILPKYWQDAVRKAMVMLRSWSAEAKDLHEASIVLERIAEDVLAT